MNLDKFTLKAQEAFAAAVNLAKEYQHQAILPEHILLPLIEDPAGVSREILIRLAVNLNDLTDKLKNYLASLPKVYAENKQVYASDRLNTVLNSAGKYKADFGDEYISSEHILLAGARERGSFLHDYLKKQGIFAEDILKIAKELRGAQKADSESAESSYRALEKYSRDLTALAKKGKLDPVIGRDEEIRRVIQVLSRRLKIIRF